MHVPIPTEDKDEFLRILGMASEEHKSLSKYIKDVHQSLRKSIVEFGAETAWHRHCKNSEILTKYAQCMEKLATTHWESNCNDEASAAQSRIKWVSDYCHEYFLLKTYTKYREKELQIAEKMDIKITSEETYSKPLKLLDVGSCYNPFKYYDIFDVFAIDLHPANDTVLQCDFLNVNIGLSNIVSNGTVNELQGNSFDIVTFCFLLEYIPTSELRILACEKAYNLLKPGGILLITTPDSKHVGANSKIMKCWRYTLALIGFNRIKYEKLKYMHCMTFRKSLDKEIACRWSAMYKEPYMEYAIQIRQDFNNTNEFVGETSTIDKTTILEDFQELPLISDYLL